MAEVSTKQEIYEGIEHLDSDEQLKVLDFLRDIEEGPMGMVGETLLRFVGVILTDELDRMAQTIKVSFE